MDEFNRHGIFQGSGNPRPGEGDRDVEGTLRVRQQIPPCHAEASTEYPKCEIAIRLDDIDWRAGGIRIRGDGALRAGMLLPVDKRPKSG